MIPVCDVCGIELDGSEHYDDMCDECAVTEGYLEEAIEQ